MWPSPPAPITTALVPAPSTGIAFLTAWIAVSPASASAAICVGCSDGSSLTTERALVEQELGEAAVAVDAGERAVDAVHVVAAPARPAQPARDERVHDHGVADLDVGHAGADLVHPAGVLVAGRVGEDDLGLLRPLALLDVQVGAAQPGRADLHDHVERAERLRLVDLLELRARRGTRAVARPSCRHLLVRSGSSADRGRCRRWSRATAR